MASRPSVFLKAPLALELTQYSPWFSVSFVHHLTSLHVPVESWGDDMSVGTDFRRPVGIGATLEV